MCSIPSPCLHQKGRGSASPFPLSVRSTGWLPWEARYREELDDVLSGVARHIPCMSGVRREIRNERGVLADTLVLNPITEIANSRRYTPAAWY